MSHHATESRLLTAAATLARPGEPIHLGDLAERLGWNKWRVESWSDKLRVMGRWPYASYPKGHLPPRYQALRSAQRERIHTMQTSPPPASFRVLEVVARARRRRHSLRGTPP